MKKRFVTIFALGISILVIFTISCKFLSSVPILAGTPKATGTATLSPLEARAGVWKGATKFGSFTFEVSPAGNEIISFNLHYEVSDGVTIQGDIELTSLPIPINEDGTFEIKIPGEFAFTAKFSKNGTSASGRWEMFNPIEASENWKIKDYKPNLAYITPVSTQAVSTPPSAQAPDNEKETQATKLEDIAGVWLETFPGGSAHLEIQPDGDTIFTVISGSNKGYHDRGIYWFENGELNVQTEGGDIGKYTVYVTQQDGKVVSLRYEVIDDSFDARREAMVYAPLTLVDATSKSDAGTMTSQLNILGCNPVNECPESSVSIKSFFKENEELLYDTEYPVSLSMDSEVRFFTGWCASEQGVLKENLKQIEFVFAVDGVSFIKKLKTNTYTVQNQTDSTKLNYCHSVGGVISGWQQDQTYRIVFGMKIKDAISDGWDTYGPGNNTRIYLISTSAEISDVNKPLADDNWQPVMFTIPIGDKFWSRSADQRYTAIGTTEDTFIWTKEIYEGNLTMSFDLKIVSSKSEPGGGGVIVFGDGREWSRGVLVFFINAEYQQIYIDTIFGNTPNLAYNNIPLENNQTYSFTIEIVDDKAFIYLGNDKIVSATLPTRVNRTGQIGLYKYWAVPEVTFSNIKMKNLDE